MLRVRDDDMEDVVNQVLDLAEDIACDSIDPDADLVDYHGFDSITLLELISQVAEHFGVKLDDGELSETCRTCRDLGGAVYTELML